VSKGFNSPRIIQCAYYQNGHSYQRYCTVSNDTPTWEDWSRLDNFGCNSADALASLLGVNGKFDKSYLKTDFSIARNSSAELDLSNKTLVLLFKGHSSTVLPAIILANSETYSVLGELPTTFTLSISSNVLTISTGNTGYYLSEFKIING